MVFSAEEKRERHRLAVQRNRARESPEQRAKRLQRQRERQVRARTAVGHNEVCQSIDEPHRSWLDGGVPTLRPVSNSTKEEVLHRLRLDLGPPGLDDATCAVCDCSKLRKSMTMVSVSDDQARIEQMQVLLSSTDEQLPPQLIAEYDCSNRFACLDGLLLSKRGIHSGGYIQVCDDCNISLTKQLLPKFAIKNGFYVGSLPSHLASATLPERLMTQTVSIVAVTRVMRGGAHRAIRSHCLAFDSMPGPAVTLLPTSVRGVSCYRVVMAGPFTTEQQARIRQMHLVRRQVVEDLLAFYCEHNALYEDVVVNCSSLAPETVADHLISEEINVDINVNDIDAESDRVGSTAEIGVTDGETDVVEHSVVFIVDDREVITQGKPPSPIQVVELPTQHTPQPQFLVRRSTRFAGKKNSLFARMFPHLFPYGRGDPNEQRQIPVSLEACIRHYSQLSTRRFAEDELFTLVSFDHLTLQRMYLHVALNCQRDPARFERYAAISEASLIEALQKKELRRQGRATATHDNSSSDSDFLKTVELSSGVVWGSDAERAQCRRRAFAYQARYGQPALFVTLTPNVGDSFVMAHYTGVSSVDTLFDANLAQLPRRSALHGASLRNDVASARLFMHNMDAFIEHVLGISPKKMKTKAFDGLFGDVKAYFGVVETQGGGTLHAHFLVWLADAPPNTDAFNRATAELGDQYNSDIATYTDSIVSTSLPLDAAVNCQFCGHSLSDLVALPIPPEAYESPNDGRGSARTEPLLVQCTQCATKMSSQHVLRRAILQQRPPTWPPPLRTYSSEELNAAVQMEVNCRGSVGAAKTAVFRRDMILATRDSVDDTYGEYLRTLNSMPYRSEQREDDAFRDDKVAQAIITLPPSVDDERWPPNATAFAVSMLVFMLNLHWWSHVGSCFKASRMSAPGQCRYRFPRVRVASTSCTSAGVELARRPPFEYVNGFNATMMLAFKSNHDVQVLIGGLEALLRIYYATKYVTKMQNVVDSVTAVALAAFKRRELREQQNQTPHSDRSALGRTRVASMAFALTNRREIAGPLAALYLLRGSCAYMSTTCTSLPLYDVLRELIQRDTHSCNLVELQEGGSSVTFRAASFLDDYTFRPLKLDRMNLYEFVMACFRRKQSKATATSDLFLPGHPLQSTHCIGHHQVEAVPVITGVRMPYVDSKTPSNLVVKRAQCALALFKPFRTVLDLVNDPASESAWIDAYLEWESTRTNFVHEIMANMDDYYHASKLAQEDEGTGSNELVHEADSDELVGTRSDIECAMGNMSNDSQTTDGGSIDDFCHVFAEDDAGAVDTDGGGSLPIFPTRGTGSLLSSIVHQELLGPTAESTAHAAINLANDEHELGLSVTGLREWVKDPTSDEAEPSLTDHPREERPSDVLELIQSALESDQEWPSPNQQHGCPTSSPLRPYPSINDVSTTFTLNHRQHVAFSLIARALLRRFQQQELANAHKSSGYSACDFESRLRDDQLLMFLGGAGGTGKSRVVDAVNAFCSGWHRDSSFVKAALTGKAATLIGGRTLASFLVRLEHAIKTKKFAPLDLLVIDEVSMMSKVEWVKLDKLLRRYMQIQNVPFGGIHVVLVGDFLQMPPVRSDPIYLDPIGKAKPSTVDVGGFELWRRFTVVVILDECVRFRGDPEWGEGCRNARLGRWTPEFIDMINTQVVQATRDGDNAQHLQDQAVASVVFVTPENSTRLAINNAFMKETAAKLPNDVYPIRVVANFKGALNGLSRSDLCYVLSLPDNRFGRMAPFLDLVQGMPIQVTQNVATAKGVANGTLGILEYVHFPAGTHFRLVRDGATSTVVQLPSRPPDYALIRVPRPHAASIRPGMDPELFPVFYATEAYTKATIRLTPAPDGQPRYVKVRPQQFPFVCAVGSTVYKVQGETLQSMIVMDWKSTQPLVNKPEQTYLLVSRVTTRNGLTALSPLTPKLVEWSKPSDHALHEEERLHGLCNATLTEFHLPVTTDVTGRCRDGNDYQSRN